MRTARLSLLGLGPVLFAVGMSMSLTAQVTTPPCVTLDEGVVNVPDGEDSMGHECAVDGDQVVFGAQAADQLGTNAGAVYVFQLNPTWQHLQTITASDGAAGDQFGGGVGLHDDVLVVGSPFHDSAANDAGTAYVYRWNGSSWGSEVKLVASDAASGDQFGYSVAVRADAIVVGARRATAAANKSGALYVYRWDGSAWNEEQKLVASDATPGATLGHSVDLTEDRLIAGALLDQGQGAAYLFSYDGSQWVEEQKLLSSELGPGHNLGQSVAVEGDVAVVGADLAGGGTGKAYVFELNGTTWNETADLLGWGATGFGWSVSVNTGLIAVGSWSVISIYEGAFLYRSDGNGWTLHQIVPKAQMSALNQGISVDVSRDHVVIGKEDESRGFLTRRHHDGVRHRGPDRRATANACSTKVVVDGDWALARVNGNLDFYQRVGEDWQWTQRVVPSPFMTGTESLALDGNRAVVGDSHFDVTNRGRVVILEESGGVWSEVDEITGSGSSFFGTHVALDGNQLLIGGSGGGAAMFEYLFDGASWVNQGAFTMSGPMSYDNRVLASVVTGFEIRRKILNNWVLELNDPKDQGLGHVVAVDGNRVVFASSAGVHPYEFDGSQWNAAPSMQTQIAHGNPAAIALDGDFLAVSYDRSDFRLDRGGAVVGFWHDGTQWNERWLWLEDVADPNNCFGRGIAIEGDELVAFQGSFPVGTELISFRPSLVLAVEPAPVEEGENLSIQLCEGNVGTPGMIAAVDVNGLAGFWVLKIGPFGADTCVSLTGPVAPGLDGLSLTMLGIGQDRRGQLSLSNLVELAIRAPGPR